jgi:hypothetical protein
MYTKKSLEAAFAAKAKGTPYVPPSVEEVIEKISKWEGVNLAVGQQTPSWFFHSILRCAEKDYLILREGSEFPVSEHKSFAEARDALVARLKDLHNDGWIE